MKFAMSAVAIAAAVAAGGYLLWPDKRDVVVVKPHTESTVVPSAMNAFTPNVAAPPLGVSVAPAPVGRPVMASLPPQTKGKRVSALIASGSPDEAFAAFKLLQDCVNARTYETERAQSTDSTAKTLNPTMATVDVCQDIDAGQITQRMLLLLKAADAGVPGTYENLHYIEADFKDDPRVQEGIPRIVEASIKRADPIALIAQVEAANHCADPPKCSSRNPEKALMLWTAFREARGIKAADTLTPTFKKELGEQRANKAITEGRELVAAARSTR